MLPFNILKGERMPKYTLTQSVKTLEKLFENNIDTDKKIKAVKWEDLRQFSPIEKSFIMDLKEAVAKRKIIEFLAGKEIEKESEK